MDFSDNDRVFIGGLDLWVLYVLDHSDHDEGARAYNAILADGREDLRSG